ncbi:inner membrane CreD family protein [Verrucomicrobiaceae bacterium 227]
MKTSNLTPFRLAAIALIFICTTVAWIVLGQAISSRTQHSSAASCAAVDEGWGPAQGQEQPTIWYLSPTGEKGRRVIQPSMSDIKVALNYEPKKKGLLWHRTYGIDFSGHYEIPNPTPISQTIYVSFPLPSWTSSYQGFAFTLGEQGTENQIPRDGRITQAVTIPAGGSVPLMVSYQTRGSDLWNYRLREVPRIRNFKLALETDFQEIDFPDGTSSPSVREEADGGWSFVWDYPDVIHPQSIGMAMPKALNAGPVAQRISFFAPVSLLFFFAVLLIMGCVKGINLHPVNYFFIASGFFAFQLLFAYLVDLLPLHLSFVIAAVVSVVLVIGYLRAVAGKELVKIALPAQLAYLVLFSYSFFFDGLSGITITIGAIATLALLMINTARMDWSSIFGKKPRPNPTAGSVS